jgi:hypothetical protein
MDLTFSKIPLGPFIEDTLGFHLLFNSMTNFYYFYTNTAFSSFYSFTYTFSKYYLLTLLNIYYLMKSTSLQMGPGNCYFDIQL